MPRVRASFFIPRIDPAWFLAGELDVLGGWRSKDERGNTDDNSDHCRAARSSMVLKLGERD